MENYVTIDRIRRRVFLRAQGQWTIEQARRYRTDMRELLVWASETGEPITLFADLDGLILHTAPVSRFIEEAVKDMERLPIERYALIVPSYLMRMQCRRLLARIEHRYVETPDEAFHWLGWERRPQARAA